jgi:FMN phosphatase YigB (HAD superfamily)/DNA-binding XRE family transcriptional regulator
MAMDEKSLGKRLQTARQQAGLTQQQLCQRANLSFSTLTKIERGAIKSPSIFTVQSIAGALSLSLDELVGQAVSSARQLSKTRSGASFIYFDMNGCMIHFYQQAFVQLSQDTGVPPDVVETAFWHYNDDVCRGTMTLDDFNAELARRFKLDKVVWQDYYLAAVEPIEQMQELMVWASQHYKVGLLTNTMPGLLGTMRRNHQLPDIEYDAIIDSSEVGAIKPEAQIYEIAQQRAGCAASEILLVDDSRVNLMAAEKLGWHVLWFDDSRPDEATARVRSTLELAS